MRTGLAASRLSPVISNADTLDAMRSVDLVIPCYNEERVLAESIATLRAWCAANLPYTWRIVIAESKLDFGEYCRLAARSSKGPMDVGERSSAPAISL